MFAVQGWNLGQLVTETAPKKKLKRKRDEKEGGHAQTEDTSIKGSRSNPFAVRQTQPPKPPIKSDPPNGLIQSAIQKPGNEFSDLRNADPGLQSSDKRAKKATRKAEKRHRRKLEAVVDDTDVLPPPVETKKTKTSTGPVGTSTFTPLQEKMRAKLTGSQFRHINEKLYTTHSSEALSLFTNEPSLFHNVLASTKFS